VRKELQKTQKLGQDTHSVDKIWQVSGLNGAAAGVQLHRTCVMCSKEKIQSGNPVFTMTARGTKKPVRYAEWYRAEYTFIIILWS